MIGRCIGADIIQEYTADDVIHQWMFTDITDTSFRWVYRESKNRRDTWQVRSEFLLHRRVVATPAGNTADKGDAMIDIDKFTDRDVAMWNEGDPRLDATSLSSSGPKTRAISPSRSRSMAIETSRPVS